MSAALPAALLERLCRLAETLPQSVSAQFAATIRKAQSVEDWEKAIDRLLPQLNPDNRGLFSDFAATWMRSPEGASGPEVAAALDAAAFQSRRLQDRSTVELVWTGPSVLSAGLRSTEQVILEMIRSARESIYVVAFAAYKIDSVATALGAAAARGVRIVFILEDKDESAGKVSLSALPALSGVGLSRVKTYIWPLDKRQRNQRGDHGALHAKCVLADSQRLLVSSANMTEFALTLNIELGVLLSGGDAPRQIERNLTELIRTGVLREFQPVE